MNRRRFLLAGAGTALSLATGGCAAAVGASGRSALAPRFPPVHVSWERVIRTTVGLRPHRPSGFVVRAEPMDGKTLVHNYGHGGAGMSLSWGTAHLATDLALGQEHRQAAVLGCGIVGLTTARVLQRRGFTVTIYARDLPPYTTSNMSWAGFTPTSSLVTDRRPAWDAQFRRAVEIAYREHQLLVGRDFGVSWIYSYSPVREEARGMAERPDGGRREDLDPLLPPKLEPGGELVGQEAHPFTTRFARRSPTLRFEPSIYLDALLRDVLRFGGAVQVRDFGDARELMTLPEPVIVNCTGLGAKQLFADDELMPIKGQLTVLVPQPEIDFSIGGMLPRRDGIVLGHVQQRGEWSLEIDEAEQARVMENAFRTFGSLRSPSTIVRPTTALNVPAEVPPVESFFGLPS